jgi:hypothetical protein
MSAANELPPRLESALRGELRSGEQVAFAAVPIAAVDSGEPRWVMDRWLPPVLLVALTTLFVGSVLLLFFGEREWLDKIPTTMLAAALALSAYVRSGSIRAQRRKAAASVTAVTDRRVILLSTAPERSVLSIEARDLDEVYCRMVSPKCGHVRFAGGLASTEANALMYVPNPRACEAAMVALRDSSRSAAGLRTGA